MDFYMPDISRKGKKGNLDIMLHRDPPSLPRSLLFCAARAQIAGSTSVKQKRIFISPLSGFLSSLPLFFISIKAAYLRGFSRE